MMVKQKIKRKIKIIAAAFVVSSISLLLLVISSYRADDLAALSLIQDPGYQLTEQTTPDPGGMLIIQEGGSQESEETTVPETIEYYEIPQESESGDAAPAGMMDPGESTPPPPPPAEPEVPEEPAPAVVEVVTEVPSVTTTTTTSTTPSESASEVSDTAVSGESVSETVPEAAPAVETTPPPAPVYTPPPRTYYAPAPVVVEEPEVEEAEMETWFLADSDGDGFTDATETNSKTDLFDAESHPIDENGNFIADEWEEKYGIAEAGFDTDGEGLYDNIEYLYLTDPTDEDTDADGYTDAEEVLDYRTDPLNGEDPADLESLGVKITGFDENQIVSDLTPLFKGVAKPGKNVEIYAKKDGGEEYLLGGTEVLENYLYLFQPENELEEGDYEFTAREVDYGADEVELNVFNDAASGVPRHAKPVKIKVRRPAEVDIPSPQRIAKETINEEIIFKNIRIEIIDNKPVLFGKTNFTYEVIATWNSIVLTSALIADSPAGEFEIQPAKDLEVGPHDVYIQAVRPKDNALSKAVRVSFSIVEEEGEAIAIEGIESEGVEKPEIVDQSEGENRFRGVAEAEKTGAKQDTKADYSWWLVGLSLAIFVAVVAVVIRKSGKKD